MIWETGWIHNTLMQKNAKVRCNEHHDTSTICHGTQCGRKRRRGGTQRQKSRLWVHAIQSESCTHHFILKQSTSCSQRDILSKAVVSSRAIATLWHSWVLEQSFSFWNLFYNDIFVDIIVKNYFGGEKVVAYFAQYKHFCTRWSFAVSLLCRSHHSVLCRAHHSL